MALSAITGFVCGLTGLLFAASAAAGAKVQVYDACTPRSSGQTVSQSVSLADGVRKSDVGLSWSSLPAFEVGGFGFSAMYAGHVAGRLLVAGGANFPDVPAADGGEKFFYDGIHTLDGAVWLKVGTLPAGAAYGVSYTLAESLILAGGAGAAGSLKSCCRIDAAGAEFSITPFAELPFPLEQAGGAVVGEVLYLAGGVSDGTPSARLLFCDAHSESPVWQIAADMPEAFVQPVVAASGGALYIWGGFDPVRGTVADYGYKYDLLKGTWERIPGVPDGGTLVGGSAVTLGDGSILIAGGVDKGIFRSALPLTGTAKREYMLLPPGNYRFRQNIYRFDPLTGAWSLAGVSGYAARAGAAMLVSGADILFLGGETKPGIRTREMWRLGVTNN